ncbi:hypothetical protein EF879_05300 [Micromonospora sp. HM5-17]|nr:hypothetical protein EF879_05300 [Micromonospora sp. HM5-17]
MQVRPDPAGTGGGDIGGADQPGRELLRLVGGRSGVADARCRYGWRGVPGEAEDGRARSRIGPRVPGRRRSAHDGGGLWTP